MAPGKLLFRAQDKDVRPDKEVTLRFRKTDTCKRQGRDSPADYPDEPVLIPTAWCERG